MTSKWWISVIAILVAVAICLAFLPWTIKMQHSYNLAQTIPRNSQAYKKITEFGNDFSQGFLAPFYIVFSKDSATEKDTLVK